jgi:hypothetical protein
MSTRRRRAFPSGIRACGYSPWPSATGLTTAESNSPPPSGTPRGSPAEPLKSVPPEHSMARRSTIGFVAVNLYEPSALAFSDSAPDPDLVGRPLVGSDLRADRSSKGRSSQKAVASEIRP